MTTNSKKATTTTAAIYSIVAAVDVLVIGGILILRAFLIGIMAIACTGQVILDMKRHPDHHMYNKNTFKLYAYLFLG
jgi:hypothetical protein